ncbi:hypothetical protein BAE30_14580 [Acidithiobacillus caldus]|uniref:Uncharacterized protein n=1 Tax=Acidithiobacillus caldus TaxID=33059 RepID=A0A1E7YS88_9PROT|nr:hypothetical protein BAE30_14580 [Acidithiobacillus caldus]
MDRSNQHEENLIRGEAENGDQQMRTSCADTPSGPGQKPVKRSDISMQAISPNHWDHLAKPEEIIESLKQWCCA